MKASFDPRHNTRKLVFSELYACLIRETPEDVDIESYKSNLNILKYDENLYSKFVPEIFKKMKELDVVLSDLNTEWSKTNIYKTDLAIIYLCIYELLYINTPQKVILDEGIELAKEFGSDLSFKFINGILAGIIDKIKK